MSEPRWTRLCVDVDAAGNPIGSSWEIHHDDVVTRVTCETPPPPFDSPFDAFADVWRCAFSLTGLVMELPFD